MNNLIAILSVNNQPAQSNESACDVNCAECGAWETCVPCNEWDDMTHEEMLEDAAAELHQREISEGY